jgi:hypothetical protein
MDRASSSSAPRNASLSHVNYFYNNSTHKPGLLFSDVRVSSDPLIWFRYRFPRGDGDDLDKVTAEHPGTTHSLVNTIVNHSIHLALRVAGGVELWFKDSDQIAQTLLESYRAAWYMGIGLAGMGVLVSALYWWKFPNTVQGCDIQNW